MYRPKSNVSSLVKRRGLRWSLPLILALGVLVAVATPAFSQSAGRAEHRATAWLRIAREQPKIVFDINDGEDFLDHPASVVVLMKSNHFLSEALRKPGVAELECVREAPDAVGWLRDHLEIRLLGNEDILEIAMAGQNPKELIRLVDAVQTAFMEKIVGGDREAQLRRKNILELVFERNMEQIQKKEYRLRELVKQQVAKEAFVDWEGLQLARERESRVLEELMSRQYRIRVELRGTRERSRILAEQLKRVGESRREALDAVELEQASLTAMLDEVQNAVKETRKALAEAERTVEEAQRKSREIELGGTIDGELEVRRMELARLREISQRMGEELARREVELAAEPRVSVLEPAIVQPPVRPEDR